MKRLCILSLALVLPACSGDDSTPPADNGVPDASTMDTSTMDTSTPDDTGVGQDVYMAAADTAAGPAPDAGAMDAGAMDSGEIADADAGPAVDASCPATWYDVPVVDPSIALPDAGVGLLLHASGSGTQNYKCTATGADGGPTSPAWVLVTPKANLVDCHGNIIATHFASVGGSGFPEWESIDGGDYVIGAKHLPTFTPDGGSGSVAWLLLDAVDAGGSGTLSMAQYIQRLDTDGGNPPAATACDLAAADAATTADIPYSAEYYFFGP